MTQTAHTGADPAAVAAARILLSQIGITPADILTGTPTAPTFGEVIPKLRLTLTPGTLRTYNTHLKHLEQIWHNRPLDIVSKADLDEQARTIQTTSRGSRNGTSAREHFVSAVRCLYPLRRR